MLNNCKDMLTVEELAQELRIGKNAAYDLVNRRIIASIRIGRKFLIPKRYLLDYLESQRYNVVKL